MSWSRKKAVALKYDIPGPDSSTAPKVVAKGAGFVAERILELAEEAGVYVHEDRDLVEILSRIEVGAEIPEALYDAVAKVLATVYRMNKDYLSRKDGEGKEPRGFNP